MVVVVRVGAVVPTRPLPLLGFCASSTCTGTGLRLGNRRLRCTLHVRQVLGVVRRHHGRLRMERPNVDAVVWRRNRVGHREVLRHVCTVAVLVVVRVVRWGRQGVLVRWRRQGVVVGWWRQGVVVRRRREGIVVRWGRQGVVVRWRRECMLGRWRRQCMVRRWWRQCVLGGVLWDRPVAVVVVVLVSPGRLWCQAGCKVGGARTRNPSMAV